MKLTRFSDYAVRVLIYLGLQQGELSTISEISTAFNISQNHLMKVVNKLSQLGYIETIRGKRGGVRLATEPSHLNLGEILRHTESPNGLLSCVNTPCDCRIQKTCRFIGILCEAEMMMFRVFDKYTLADLLTQESSLRKALSVPAPSG